MRTAADFRTDLRGRLEASLAGVEAFISEFREWAARLSRPDLFAAELLLREALTNAVTHGGRNDARRRVLCIVRLRRRQLTISVRDGGIGFDWKAERSRPRAAASPSGRGIQILCRYATHVRYVSSGSSIFMFRRLSEGNGE